jgi:predicted RNase H-like HicB family nuclease
VLEKAKRNYSAYVPDLPGSVATRKTAQEALAALHAAIEFHLEGLVEDGDLIPDPVTLVDYVEVHIPAAVSKMAWRSKTQFGDENRAVV